MKLKTFMKDKLLTILLLVFALATIEIFLIPYQAVWFLRVYIPVVILAVYFIAIAIEYGVKRSFYLNLENTLDELQEKYLICEIVKTPNFTEGKLLKEILRQINSSMIENVNKYKYLQEEYKDYIELWIHEIKLPIASR